MNRQEVIIQRVWDIQDNLRDVRPGVFELVLEGRKAARQDDRYIAEKRFSEAARELRASSSEQAQEAAQALEAEAHRVRNGG